MIRPPFELIPDSKIERRITREEARGILTAAIELGRGYLAARRRCADTAEAYETLACLAIMRDALEGEASEALLRALEKCYFSCDPALRAYRAATTSGRGNDGRSRQELARTLAKMGR